MNDMSASPAIDADEFGGLDHLVLPGQDPDLIHRLHGGFTAHLKPRNFIERMWARDMAIETAISEYLRVANVAVHHELIGNQAEAAQDEEGPTADLDNGGQHEGEHRARDPKNPRLAKAFANNLGIIAQLLHIEREVLAERDRLIFIYDGRTDTAKALKDARRKISKLTEANSLD